MSDSVKKPKEIKITVVKQEDMEQWDEESQSYIVKFPSKYYIVTSLGEYKFYHVRSRAEAQAEVDREYGKGFYTVRQAKMDTGSGNYSCTGTTSRRGTASHLKKTV